MVRVCISCKHIQSITCICKQGLPRGGIIWMVMRFFYVLRCADGIICSHFYLAVDRYHDGSGSSGSPASCKPSIYPSILVCRPCGSPLFPVLGSPFNQHAGFLSRPLWISFCSYWSSAYLDITDFRFLYLVGRRGWGLFRPWTRLGLQ